MLLECLNGSPLTIDGAPFMDNIRLNIANNHQFRLKFLYIADEKHQPIDIVVLNYTIPKLSMNSLTINVSGVEKQRNIRFSMDVSYHFFKKKWIISGTFMGKEINKEFLNILEIIKIFKEVL